MFRNFEPRTVIRRKLDTALFKTLVHLTYYKRCTPFSDSTYGLDYILLHLLLFVI